MGSASKSKGGKTQLRAYGSRVDGVAEGEAPGVLAYSRLSSGSQLTPAPS
jgi:hypothetical protein